MCIVDLRHLSEDGLLLIRHVSDRESHLPWTSGYMMCRALIFIKRYSLFSSLNLLLLTSPSSSSSIIIIISSNLHRYDPRVPIAAVVCMESERIRNDLFATYLRLIEHQIACRKVKEGLCK